ncbi:putative Fe-S protein [Spongiibacter sp. IMCC21906]|uniref:DUF1289 domain-containing protein n=1 Tax=Spongiibacter sp. IMCC21906 TaxID=1620392 RepID=UPI00062DE9F7|nr:putative Fe-S protein [Spongiibacter sp. IMCC21906]
MVELLRRVPTPCIGVCSTGIGDNVCRGCKRFCHEVIDWNGYTPQQKQIIDQRLDRLLIQVMTTKLHIVNAELLAWQLNVQSVRFPQHKDPYIWLFQLLRAGAGQISEPRKYGFVVDTAWRDQSLLELREAIDKEFFELSHAYYDRYFNRYMQGEG